MDTPQCSECEALLGDKQWGAMVREGGEDKIVCQTCKDVLLERGAGLVIESQVPGLIRCRNKTRLAFGG